ncbi:MAG: hypothetical protein ACUVV0_15865 [Anaerolineae bacterium]
MEKIYFIDKREITAKGKEIYARIGSQLEPHHKGEIVAIETESGDYFLGKTPMEAIGKAEKKYPDKVFYLVRIGHRAVHIHR